MASAEAPARRWLAVLAVVPLTALSLGVWLLVLVGRYPHHDLQAAYATLIGWGIGLSSGFLALLMLRPSFRPAVAVISVIPLLLGVVGLAFWADLAAS